MLSRRNLFLFISSLIFCLLSSHLRAEKLNMTIIAQSDLHAGKIPDSTLLARIRISGINSGCVLNVWDETTSNETTPGQYTLSNAENGEINLSVKLHGENWQPNTVSGKGIFIRNSTRFSEIKLLSRGEQFIASSSLTVQLSAKCIMDHLDHKEEY